MHLDSIRPQARDNVGRQQRNEQSQSRGEGGGGEARLWISKPQRTARQEYEERRGEVRGLRSGGGKPQSSSEGKEKDGRAQPQASDHTSSSTIPLDIVLNVEDPPPLWKPSHSLPWRRRRQLQPTLFFRCLVLLVVLLAFNFVLWIAALTVSSPREPNSFASLCLLAWATGLRHALDADHITAIDNATRRIIGLPVTERGKSNIQWKRRLWHRFDKRPGSQNYEEGEDKEAKPSEKEFAMANGGGPTGACRRPITCGLFFSLGHSTIVFAVTIAISVSVSVASRLDGIGGVGGIIGQSVSGGFLMLVAVINTFILISTLRRRRQDHHELSEQGQASAHSGKQSRDGEDAELASQHELLRWQPRAMRTILTRLAAPLLRLVTQPYHMYPIGVLFGLGFDTASTIALLSISAVAGSSHLASESDLNGSDVQSQARSIRRGDAKVVLLALLFTAGMTFVDSCDSVLMIYAYAPPQRASGSKQKWWSLWEAIPVKGASSVRNLRSKPQGRQQCSGDGKKEPLKDCAIDALEVDGTGVEVFPPQAATGFSSSPPSVASTAQALSLLLTSLSILFAFVISCIVLMSLIASKCTQCAAAAEAHNNPISETDAGVGASDGVRWNNGGLAGSWWSFWLKTGDASEYIGVGIVALFFLVVVSWWSVGACVVRRRRAKGQRSA